MSFLAFDRLWEEALALMKITSSTNRYNPRYTMRRIDRRLVAPRQLLQELIKSLDQSRGTHQIADSLFCWGAPEEVAKNKYTILASQKHYYKRETSSGWGVTSFL